MIFIKFVEVIALSKIGGESKAKSTNNILRYVIGTDLSTGLRLTASSGKVAIGSAKLTQVIRGEKMNNILNKRITRRVMITF